MTRPWHAPLRGLLAPFVAILALPAAALFVCSCHVQSALPGLVWQGTTAAGVLGLCLLPRFRARPGVPAGLLGVAAWGGWVACMAGLSGPGPGTVTVLGSLAAALSISVIGAAFAERASVMRETSLPGNRGRLLVLALALLSSVWVTRLATSEAPAPRIETGGEVLGSVEIPALATTLRERLGLLDPIELVAVSEPQPGGEATARVWLSRPGAPYPAERLSGSGCVLEVPALGRTVEVVAQEQTYAVRWPVSPHGESFAVCTYDRATLAYYPDGVLAHEAAPELGWGLGLGAPFALLVLALGWRVRRRHARIARSPEVRVTSPGLATLPDGSLATLGEDVPMGTSVVALRIADRRPDYRSDARVAIEEHVAGEKNALLADLARRTRTLELLALAGVLLLGSVALGAALSGIILTV